jgi:hypothetical protein
MRAATTDCRSISEELSDAAPYKRTILCADGSSFEIFADRPLAEVATNFFRDAIRRSRPIATVTRFRAARREVEDILT